jgi:hypothetical protein
MPFTGASDPDLPKNIQDLPEGRREQWVAVFNRTHEKCTKENGDDCEVAAFKQANGVVLDEKGDPPDVGETQKAIVETEKGESLERLQHEIAVAFDAQHGQDDGAAPSISSRFWIVEMFTDHIIVEKDNEFWSAPYTRNLEGEIVFANESEWTQVEEIREWVAKAAKMKAEAAAQDAGDADRFSVYKQDDGTWRWVSISSVAVKDKEFEIVTEKARDDAIQHAIDTGEFGEIDLVHVDGTDVGKCDLMMGVGNRLVEGGTFDDTEIARGAIKAIRDDPDHWGISIRFVFDPSKFDGEKYNGNIRIKKRTILPQEMAASFGTRLVAIGGQKVEKQQEISDRARDALERLNVSEEKIDSLAEKQIDAEPNTVEKEAETVNVETPEPETVEVEKTLWDRIKDIGALFSKPETEETEKVDAETGGEENTAEAEPVDQEEAKGVDVSEIVGGLFDTYAEATAKAVGDALKQRDEQIASIGEAVLMLSEQIKSLQAPIEDRIEKRLAELPPIVKAAPSQTATLEKPASGRALPYQTQTKTGDFAGELMKGITSAVEQELAKLGKVQV